MTEGHLGLNTLSLSRNNYNDFEGPQSAAINSTYEPKSSPVANMLIQDIDEVDKSSHNIDDTMETQQ